jgi:hypothetical protein
MKRQLPHTDPEFITEFDLVSVKVPPLDAPDAPGWWAFEGKHKGGLDKGHKTCYYLIDLDGGLVVTDGEDEDPWVITVPRRLEGKWWKIAMPWEKE